MLDMTAMYAAHQALRRDLELVARTAARTDDDPRQILRTMAGWELFKKALHVHHTGEDEGLWPVMRESSAGRPDDLALLDAMEAEHAQIDPILAAVDAAAGDPEPDPQRLGDLTDALVVALTEHLKHEEKEALPLIQAIVSEAQWQRFGQANARLIGPDAALLLPWMLDGAGDEVLATMLAPLPPPVRQMYENEWRPAYAALDKWRTRN
jgi:hemerythrin-like domain-containing protein